MISSASRPAIFWSRSIPPIFQPRSVGPRLGSQPRRRRTTISPTRSSCNTPLSLRPRRSRCPRPLRKSKPARRRSGTHKKRNKAVAAYAGAQADVRASRAVIAEQRHQLEVLSGTKKQRAADIEAAKATLAAAKLKLGYTKITAPFDGVVGEREVQPNDYVNIGSNLINVVPLPNVYIIANYKETQLTRVTPGQPVDVTVDGFPNERLHGRVKRISPASGSQFALLPPDNATGNFTKVVQRVPVRIVLDKDQPLLERLLPGMSVVTQIHTDEAGADGGK